MPSTDTYSPFPSPAPINPGTRAQRHTRVHTHAHRSVSAHLANTNQLLICKRRSIIGEDVNSIRFAHRLDFSVCHAHSCASENNKWEKQNVGREFGWGRGAGRWLNSREARRKLGSGVFKGWGGKISRFYAGRDVRCLGGTTRRWGGCTRPQDGTVTLMLNIASPLFNPTI